MIGGVCVRLHFATARWLLLLLLLLLAVAKQDVESEPYHDDAQGHHDRHDQRGVVGRIRPGAVAIPTYGQALYRMLENRC